jgi:uncharacterized membrane protein YfcA
MESGSTTNDILLSLAMAAAAFLYTAVGHGGASAYLALMLLWKTGTDEAKTAALTLNLAAAGLTTTLRWLKTTPRFDMLLPLLAGSVPAAWIGARTALPASLFELLAAVTLLYAAIRLVLPLKTVHDTTKTFPVWAFVLTGAVIGWFSGLLGIGGGIFLSPVLLLFRLATLTETALVSALFIVINSATGLVALLPNPVFPAGIVFMIPAVMLGGWLGTRYALALKNPQPLRTLLALALFIAAVKLFLKHY